MFTLTIFFSSVHGFTNVSYTVTEGETLNITFTNDIKGSSNLPPFLLGTISVLPDTARMYAYFIVTYLEKIAYHVWYNNMLYSLCFTCDIMTSTEEADFEAINVQVFSESAQISFVAVYDEIMELNESVIVQFVHSFIPYISFLESRGEFLRNTTIVDIIDCKHNIIHIVACIMTVTACVV